MKAAIFILLIAIFAVLYWHKEIRTGLYWVIPSLQSKSTSLVEETSIPRLVEEVSPTPPVVVKKEDKNEHAEHLPARVTELEAVVEKLRSENEGLKLEKTSKNSERLELGKKLQSAIEEKQVLLKDLEEERKRNGDEKLSTRTAMSQRDKELAELKGEMVGLEEAKDHLTGELGSSEEKRKALEEKLQKVYSDSGSLGQEIAILKKANDAETGLIKAELAKKVVETKRLVSQISELQTALEREKTTASTQKSFYADELKSIQLKIEQAEAEKGDLRSKLAELDKAKTVAEAGTAERDVQIRTLLANIDVLSSQEVILVTNSKALQKEVGELKGRLQDMVPKGTISSPLEHQIADLKEALEASQAEQRKLRDQLAEHASSNATLRGQLLTHENAEGSMVAKVAELQSELERERQEKRSLDAQPESRAPQSGTSYVEPAPKGEEVIRKEGDPLTWQELVKEYMSRTTNLAGEARSQGNSETASALLREAQIWSNLLNGKIVSTSDLSFINHTLVCKNAGHPEIALLEEAKKNAKVARRNPEYTSKHPLARVAGKR